MRNVQIRGQCPKCGAELDRWTPRFPHSHPAPAPGDYCKCLECERQIFVLEADGALRALDAERMRRLALNSNWSKWLISGALFGSKPRARDAR